VPVDEHVSPQRAAERGTRGQNKEFGAGAACGAVGAVVMPAAPKDSM